MLSGESAEKEQENTDMLTPPFGMIVFAMKGVLGDKVELMQLFKCCTPYIFLMLVVILLCAIFPQIVLVLPSMM